ncbi:polyamine aminopropyltransferase [Magnetofaba australis]|uniref:Polyamine aminopropyltransferase n=1 Tax=Magnetofaba australis IT-1 TaxID=1434232 RepID=A0A1Y2K8R1_9PROT|nr:polyamine aminopropyltransferase [Magnetofaba australis]OSM07140.1 putative spermidine synthase [Magnetofaba australis IT-1]
MTASDPQQRDRDVFTLVYAIFTAGLCSIIYELLIATAVVYFRGDSVFYFSLTIGLYMAAMGAGAYLSKFLRRDLIERMIAAEILLGLLGGLSAPLIYLAYLNDAAFIPVYSALTLIIGLLIGLETPLLTRILETYDGLRVGIAHVLSLDYLGALAATVAFPLLLLPLFGTFRTSLLFGLINMSIAGLLAWRFGPRLPAGRRPHYRRAAWGATLLIIAGLASAHWLLALWNQSAYSDRIVHAERTRFQEVVLTRHRNDLRLYLNGALQFSAIDEYRYHEALIHLPMARLAASRPGPWRVLVLGGGDGLAVRELLRYTQIARIDLIDLDERVLELARENPHIRALNGDSLRDKRAHVQVGDAMSYLNARGQLYDLIVADLPDPSSTDVARLYSDAFHHLVKANLAPGGVFVTQATSPFYARAAFWTIHNTVRSVFGSAIPYHLNVPSFGEWGFVMAGGAEVEWTSLTWPGLRYLRPEMATGLLTFGGDIDDPGDLGISTIDRPTVLERYQSGWRYWSD